MKKYSYFIIGLVILIPGLFVPSIWVGIECSECDHNHDEYDDLQGAYIPCDCGHGTCTGNIETCPCCGLGAPPPPPPPPPGRIIYVPDVCIVSYGTITGGDPFESPRYDDGDELWVQLMFFGIPLIQAWYLATVKAQFYSHPRVIEAFIDIGLDANDLWRWADVDIYVTIRFTDGSGYSTLTPADVFDFPMNLIFDPNYIDRIDIDFIYENLLPFLDVRAWFDCINVIW